MDAYLRSVETSGALSRYLGRQRWFPGRTRAAASVSIDEAVVIGEGAWLLVVRVRYEDGLVNRFAMPVALASGDAAGRVKREAGDRVIDEWPEAGELLHDDMAEGLGAHLLRAMSDSLRWPAASGVFVGEASSAFASLRGPAAMLPARRLATEQSNTSVVFGDRLILKVIRRLEPGLHPDYEVTRHLTERCRFDGVAAFAGALAWRSDDGESTIVAIAQAFVPGAVPLRERFVLQAADVMRADAGGPEAVRNGGRSRGGAAERTLADAELLGRRTGELHLALADAGDDAAFAPESVAAADLRATAEGMRAGVTSALDELGACVADLPSAVRDAAAQVLAGRAALMGTTAGVASVTPGFSRIRVHGDYQLDQVLESNGSFVIIDFEGEPLRPLAERRAKAIAMKDVAGMVRSFSYAAYAGLFEVAADDRDAADRLDTLARRWQRDVAMAFVGGYRGATIGAPFVPADPSDFDALLNAFIVEKAAYELRYELSHRLAWLRIPLAGILAILG